MRAANRHHQTLLPLLAGGAGGLVRNGLVAEYRFDESRNLLKYSQQFDNAAWTKTDCAITANDAAAPDGTTTADKVTLTVGAAQSCVQSVTVAASTSYVFSIWVKLGTATALKYAIYNVSGSADIVAATSYGATTSWVRYAIPFTTPAGCTSVSIRPVKDSAQDNGTTAWIWGAQLEQGSVARTYYKTTDKQLLMDYSRPRKNLLLPNQANCCEDGTTTGFGAVAGATLSASIEQAYQGSYSLKIVTPNVAGYEGMWTSYLTPCNPSRSYTASCRVMVGAGITFYLTMYEWTDAGGAISNGSSSVQTGTGSWQIVTYTRTVGSTTGNISLRIQTSAKQAATFYVDGLQLEEGSTATAWEAPPNIGICGSTTGADTNDPTYTGQGASFTTDDYINCGKEIAGANGKAPMTLLVVYAHSGTPTDYETIAGKVSLYTNEWGLRTGGANTTPVFSVRGGGAPTTGVGSALTVGVYSCITGTFDGTYPRIYNGSTLTHTGRALAPQEVDTSSKVFYIGCNTAPRYCFNGNVAYVAVWNRALTQAEITQNYNYLKGYLLRERGIALA